MYSFCGLDMVSIFCVDGSLSLVFLGQVSCSCRQREKLRVSCWLALLWASAGNCGMPPTNTMKTASIPSAAPRATVLVKPEHKGVAIEDDPQVRQQKKGTARLDAKEEETLETATSPRVRRRLSNAQESASIFSMVCEQGEVIQWMTACHPDLTPFGIDLERRGYRTLSSIAFLTEEDVEGVTNSDLRQLLLTTLSRLRHELFRM